MTYQKIPLHISCCTVYTAMAVPFNTSYKMHAFHHTAAIWHPPEQQFSHHLIGSAWSGCKLAFTKAGVYQMLDVGGLQVS